MRSDLLRIVFMAAVIAAPVASQTVSELDREMTETLAKWNVPGGSLAIVRDGRLVYAKGFGVADIDTGEPVAPDSLFRIASLTKTFTAAGILKLVEEGKLDLEARAFEILSDLQPPAGSTVDPRIYQITVRQLLQHTGGWDREISGDPFTPPNPLMAARALGVPEPAEPEVIIRYMMSKPLDFDPGARMSYSNLGYCILGRIIEKVSGMRYESFIRTRLLGPAGISRMFQSGMFREDRVPGEVRYHSWSGEQILLPSVIPDRPGLVEPQYGGGYSEAMDAEGAWVGSAIDLARWGVALDRLLSPETRALYAQRPPSHLVEANGVWYGFGWYTWFAAGSGVDMSHSGGLPGTRTFLIKRSNGTIWTLLFNSGRMDEHGDMFLNEVANRIDTVVWNVRSWPTDDLFPQYLPDSPRFAVTGVENSASYTQGPVAPGEALAVFGAGCEGGDVRVAFDGVQAEVIAAESHRIDAIVPETIAAGSSSMQVECAGRSSEPVTLAVAAAAPGILTANNTGRGQAVAVNEDGSANAPDKPAAQGSIVSLSVTGVRESDVCSVQLGTHTVESDAVQSVSPGVVKVSFRIPEDLAAGAETPVVVVAAGSKSRSGVTIAVR